MCMTTSTPIQRQIDLEERTTRFARSVRGFIRRLPKSLSNLHDSRQLIRSSGSIGARYVEAGEAQSRKDFLLNVLFSLKSSKETEYWLKLLDIGEQEKTQKQHAVLLKEADELQRIMGSIASKMRAKEKAAKEAVV